uniref:Uncharacterized protein n=1 Tax=Anguilla anguilla TaxID=7936 RepID=A0A0E9URW6_ANGAN
MHHRARPCGLPWLCWSFSLHTGATL